MSLDRRVGELLERVSSGALEASGLNPLYLAFLFGRDAVAAVLVRNPIIGCEAFCTSLLHRAAERGHLDILRELLAAGADTRLQNRLGSTPLHLALFNEQEVVAGILADYPNDLTDWSGYSPLHYAAQKGYLGIVRKLLLAGANTRLQNSLGSTPIHVALYNEHEAVAGILAYDQNDFQSVSGYSPLHRAAEKGYLGVVKKLLWGGAHPHLKNRMGQYPFQVVPRARQDEFAPLFISMCALRSIPFNWEPMNLLSTCKRELTQLKLVPIEGSRLSFYDVARLHPSRTALFLRIEIIRQATGIWRSMRGSFPYYEEIIAFKLGRLEERRILYNSCVECFWRLSRGPLPLLCVDLILLCLRDCELRNLLLACTLDP